MSKAVATPGVPSIARVCHWLEITLAIAVLGTTGWLFSPHLPRWPTWPEIAGLPVNPELLLPAALSLAVLCRIPVDGVRVGSLFVAPLAAFTLWFAGVGWYVLWADLEGGVFFHGLLSIAAGLALAGLVVLRVLLPEQLGLESRLELRQWIGR